MQQSTPVTGALLAAVLASGALLGGGLLAGCQRQEAPQQGEQVPGPAAEASPEAAPSPAAEASPEAAPSPAAEATPEAAPSPAAQATPEAAPSPAAQASPAGQAQAPTAQAGPGAGGRAAGGSPVPATPASLQAGQQLFAQNCASCHGQQGKGDGPAAVALNPKPADLTDRQWKYGGSPQEIYQTITQGVPGTAMVSWSSIPEQGRWNLVNYVLSLQGK